MPTLFRLVIRDIRTGSLLSVKSAAPDTVSGLEPGDVIVEAVPQRVIEGRPASDAAQNAARTDGWVTVGEYHLHLPRVEDDVVSAYPLSVAPWAQTKETKS